MTQNPSFPGDSHSPGPDPGEAWPPWADPFLKALRLERVVAKAAALASVSRTAAYELRKKSPSFAEAWDVALDDGESVGMRLLWERAFVGWDTPIWSGHQIVGFQHACDSKLALAWFKYWSSKKDGALGKESMTPQSVAAALHDLIRRCEATVPRVPPPTDGEKPC